MNHRVLIPLVIAGCLACESTRDSRGNEDKTEKQREELAEKLQDTISQLDKQIEELSEKSQVSKQVVYQVRSAPAQSGEEKASKITK